MDYGFKTTFLILPALALLFTFEAKSHSSFYSPVLCSPQDLRIEATNFSRQSQRFWTQVRIGKEIEEIPFDIEARKSFSVNGGLFLTDPKAFSIKSWEASQMRFQLSCEGRPNFLLSGEHSPDQVFKFDRPVTAFKGYLGNLFLKENEVKLRALDRFGKMVDERNFALRNHYDTEEFKWELERPVSRVELRADNRISAVLTYESTGKERISYGESLPPRRLNTNPNEVYFLVSTKSEGSESFVIGMSEPDKIALAREQIRNPALEKIIVAGIQLGHGETNRSFSQRNRAPYSWSVFRVDAFADFAHIDCDGSPDIVEERILQRLNEGGRICFWRYRIIKELTPEEVSTGQLQRPSR